VKRHHAMPFGAETRDDGTTRFRLWAPGAREVALVLDGADGSSMHPVGALAGGWYELVTDRAPHGTRYRYRIDDALLVPDPVSRCNPDGVHAASLVIDPARFEWDDAAWRGRPWEEAVIYELHVGTFTAEGTYAALRARLPALAALGVTALELMPIAAFPGRRNWGYDGVLPFAPVAAYGTPDELKQLVQAAHAHGLMVLLDVVYNHFGPDGNYLHAYAPQFFNARHHTPWGSAINFDGEANRTVRDFFIHNALYWLDEYHLDGLRLDAVHAICDDSTPDILTELARAVRAGPGAGRHVHLVLENDHNAARYLVRDAAGKPSLHTAQWNDDVHHAAHILVTGERDGYYEDYAARPLWYLGRCLAEGFGYQGEISHHRHGVTRGERSDGLPPTAFIGFTQTHDQVGNRAFGERLCALAEPEPLKLVTTAMLLAPAPPLLFMGEEFAATSPFLFFCDFGPDLAGAVRDGRRREFARFARFADPKLRERIPDPNTETTFLRSRLDWDEQNREPHRAWLEFYREVLGLRHRHLVPRLAGARAGSFAVADTVLTVSWPLAGGATLHLLGNFGSSPARVTARPRGERLYSIGQSETRVLAPWSGGWWLDGGP
jgi:maltooligosyltrehalose trehalohydrolase